MSEQEGTLEEQAREVQKALVYYKDSWALSPEARKLPPEKCSREGCTNDLVDADGKRIRGYVTTAQDSRTICYPCWNEWRMLLPLVQRLFLRRLLYQTQDTQELRVVQVNQGNVAR